MTANRVVPRAPAGLGDAGRSVWRRILADVPEEWELDAREMVILEAAARQADLNRALEAAFAEDGVMVMGSQGQARMNAVATELRQGRIAVEKLLSSLALPGEDGHTMTAAQKRAQAAAESRWGRGRRSRGAA